jgi:hypothetical protein
LGVREEDNPVSPADKPLNSPQETNGLLNLSLRIFSFNNGDSDFLVGGLSAGGKKGASAHDACQQSDFLQELPSFDHVFLLNA